jgi:hypothetical protein
MIGIRLAQCVGHRVIFGEQTGELVQAPIDRCVEGVAEVDPKNALRLQLWQRREKNTLKKLQIVARIIFSPCALREPLPPIWRAGHEHIDAGVWKLRDESKTVAVGNRVQRKRP